MLSITTFFSYLAGLIRDRMFARTFGLGSELDLYNASFIIPDLLLNILVSSALSAAFIPVFTGLFSRGEKEQSNQLANTVLHGAVLAVLISGLLAAIFMPLLARFIAPGFSIEQQEYLVSLSRLMMISPLIMAVSSTLGAMLISYKTFLPYGLSPIFYNAGIIAGILAQPWFGVYGLVLGTLLGAMLHLLPRLVAIARSPFAYRFALKIRDPHFFSVIKLMIPKMVGHPVEQLTFLSFTRIATTLAAGSVAAVSFARNFQSVPVALFGIAFSVAAYPRLCEAAGKMDREDFLKNFRKALRDILLFTLPCTLGLYFLSFLPIRILLGGGNFSDEHVLRTAGVLSVFALSIPTESLVHLLARSFYAFKNTLTPVLLSVVGFVIIISFSYLKTPTLGLMAIPYGFFLGSAVEAALLALLLRLKLKTLRPTWLFSPAEYPAHSSRESPP